MKRVAVVGSGIAGLATAHALAGQAQVTLFEAGDYFGGHTHTVDVTLDGVTHGVDTGFLVFNPRTYPNLVRLFRELQVETAPSDMSFSVQARQDRLEWSGSSLDTVFAQRHNLLRPRFWRHAGKTSLRFNKPVHRHRRGRRRGRVLNWPSRMERLPRPGTAIQRHAFRDWYLLPMLGCIWSCPTDQMLRFPVATMIRFCHNHGLLQVANRPQLVHRAPAARCQYVEQACVERHPRRAPAARRCAACSRVPPGQGTCRRDAVHRAAAPSTSTTWCWPATCRPERWPCWATPRRPSVNAACWAPSATRPTAPCCTPTLRCCRSRRAGLGGSWNFESAANTGGEQANGLPALPHQPPAAAAFRSSRWSFRSTRCPTCRIGARRSCWASYGYRTPHLRPGRHPCPEAELARPAGPRAGVVLRCLGGLRLP